tara:strand:- start:1721 stop:1993 length:273 start_codon:yes stop_codon:yes gene_type:complete
MKINQIISKIAIISSYILAMLLIIMVILKLTNHSPAIEEVILGFLIFNLTITIGLLVAFYELKGEFKHYKKKVDAIGNDLKQYIFKSSQN